MIGGHLISCFVRQLFQFYGGGHTWKVNMGHPDNFRPLLKYFLFNKKGACRSTTHDADVALVRVSLHLDALPSEQWVIHLVRAL